MSVSPVPQLDVLMNYEYPVKLDGASAAAHVIRMVNQGSKVLDIGAGAGSITRHLAGVKQCKVTAVEINPDSVAKLCAYCASVYPLDLNDKNWTQELQREGLFDVVLAADVLEHLYDPWTTLRQMKSLLKPEGSIILSLPHAGHCAVLASLMDGDFAYGEWGLLDKTHIRFFGIKNIQAMHDSTGLEILEAKFVLRPPENMEMAQKWAQVSPELKAHLRAAPHADVYQVVTRAARSGKGLRLMDAPVG